MCVCVCVCLFALASILLNLSEFHVRRIKRGSHCWLSGCVEDSECRFSFGDQARENSVFFLGRGEAEVETKVVVL